LDSQIFESDVNTDLQAIGGELESYYISSVKMPTLKVKGEEFKRDSRPYMMPGFDEALSEISVTFVMDTPVNATVSKVYRFLETWRAFVRAGRGAMGDEKSVWQLGAKYRAEFRYPVTISLLRGNVKPEISNLSDLNSAYSKNLDSLQEQLVGLTEAEKNAKITQILGNGGVPNADQYPVNNALVDAAVFKVENMWLSSFKMSDLDYTKGNEIVKIEATFFADNIRDLSQ